MMLESAKNSFPYSFSNVKVKKILNKKENTDEENKKCEELENIVLELFNPLNNEESAAYLPDHPVFIILKI